MQLTLASNIKSIMKEGYPLVKARLTGFGYNVNWTFSGNPRMSQIIFQKIIELLSGNKVLYELLEHEPVYTSEQAAKIRGTNLSSGAKALIFKAEDKPLMIVVPGDRRVDTRKFKETYHIADLAMATPEEVEKFTNGVKIGAVHPFGNLHGLEVYIDRALGRNQTIVFNAGLHDKSIKMKYKDYYRLVKPKLGDFSI